MGEAGGDVINSKDGNVPGAINKELLSKQQPAPEDTYGLVRKPVVHTKYVE